MTNTHCNASDLKTDSQLTDADGFYEHLLDAHHGLSEAASSLYNARLILVLANQIGDAEVLRQCIAAARVPTTASQSTDNVH